jgi:hypothetical protein
VAVRASIRRDVHTAEHEITPINETMRVSADTNS